MLNVQQTCLHQSGVWWFIEVLKITRYLYDATVPPHFPLYARANTRGNNYIIILSITIYASIFFSACIANNWNSLPNSVVDASTTDAFKARLDKFWLN